MRVRLLIAATIVSVALTTIAFTQAELSPAAILGKWKATAQHTSGATLTTVLELKKSMQFTTTTTVNAAPFMEASGTWKVTGKTLEWQYEQTSPPSIPKGFVDVDEIQSVSATEMKLTSKQSGKTHAYQKVQ
jgi:hypothetical protein